ncbi:MAG: shikimate dehydrogenase [Peptococcaceae bacterium]|jgi:shikimate dehydrogenase|nr:shikimate dehydrogenase [Peptococcaceae bacterium]
MISKYALIGFPVEHSLSPLMHEAGFKALNLKAEYHKLPLQIHELSRGLDYLRQNNYAGWNVTYPLKEKILPLLDFITPEARTIGAVNTVKVTDGLLQGFNTDGDGFVQSLVDRGYSLAGKKVVLLGAGGAAKSIAVSLLKNKASILVLNRTLNKAQNLVRQIASLGGNTEWGVFAPGDWLQEVDLLIQATSLGLKGEQYPFSIEGINPAAWVVDLIYSPTITPFLAQAAHQGCKTWNGLEMLLYQGALAWKIWLNREAPLELMRQALLTNQNGEESHDHKQ